MHHKKFSAGLQKLLRRADDILQCAENLVAGDGLRKFRIGQTVISRHIGRIGGDDIKGSQIKQLSRLFNIAFHDGNPVLQVVIEHASPCHIRAPLLDLQAREMTSLRFSGQKNRNDAGSRPQIQYLFSLLHLCKTREQHRIHPETELAGILNDFKAVSLEIIQPFLRFQLNCHLALISLHLFPEPSVPSAPCRSGSASPFSGGA